MEQKTTMDPVHYFIRGLFRGVTETEKIAEQREELEAHMRDRISDSMEHGSSHDDAFAGAVDSLGNLDELIDTITGKRKKIYVNRMNWYTMAFSFAYGTLYMLAIGIWFCFMGFGAYAAFVALAGWCGFLVPALIRVIDYLRHPFATEMLPVDNASLIRSSVVGWLAISLACWVVNFCLIGSGTFLAVIWAWMPTFGIMTWPMMTISDAWMIKNLKSLEPEESV
jgi:hypothetical protein